MYQVVKLYGDTEPWWFFEEWEEDIVKYLEFDDFYEALKCYKKVIMQASKNHEKFCSRADFLSAFWDEEECVWCEECGEDLQQYHSYTLLEDWHPVTSYEERRPYSRKNGSVPFKVCSRKIES